MARPRFENPNYRIVSLKCVADGTVIDFKDYGSSYKTGDASVEYGRILRALKRRSKLDGKKAFKIVSIKDPKLLGKTLQERLADLGQKAPIFEEYDEDQMWSEADDARLAAHLGERAKRSAAAQAQGVADAYRKKSQKEGAAETATAVVMALKEAGVIGAPEPAKPQPKKAPAAPKKEKA